VDNERDGQEDESTGDDNENPVALQRNARFFFVVSVAAAIFCAYSATRTLRFISETTLAEGTVVDWTQGHAGTIRSDGPGAYFRIIEIQGPNGQRIRGEAQVGVEMRRLVMGERVQVRYRASDPTRMRVVSLSDLWIREMVSGVIAMVFGLGGWSLVAQRRRLLASSPRHGVR
jgi:hypothetical protein